jgi:Tol biopolymer transport system component
VKARGLLWAVVFFGIAAAIWAVGALVSAADAEEKSTAAPALTTATERHLKNVRQLTFGGQNAEGYFSADDRWLIFQHMGDGVPCDRIYTLPLEVTEKLPTPRQISSGKGRTTCGYFFPSGDRVLYSSTHLGGDACPPTPDYSRGYVWPIYDSYDIFTARRDGSHVRRLTRTPGYDAEATISRDGKKIVFTSMRDGDLEIYTMNADGSSVRRLTHEVGYDGGPFFSADGSKIVYRAQHPKTPSEVAEYKSLLAEGLIRPGNLELWVMNADGSGKRQITGNGAANFAPFWHPDGKRIIFASNRSDPKGREFDLYLVNADGTGLERVTDHPDFDGFPMFRSDGKQLVWASNRNGKRPRETNLFLADWVE